MSKPGAKSYHTGPWLFGTQRANLARVFQALNWDAVPVQPIQGPRMGSTGIWWAVTSPQSPPAQVLATNHGEVLVVEQRPKAVPVPSDPLVVATRSAMRKFVSKAEVEGADADPLQAHDPWKQYLDTKGHSLPKASGSGGSGQVAKPAMPNQGLLAADFHAWAKRIEDNMSAQLAQHVAKANQEVQDKIGQTQAAVSHKLQEVQQVAQQLEDSVSAQVAGHASQLQASVDARFAQVEHQVTCLHGRVDAQESSLQQVIQNMFNAQTLRIEELLAPKRARSDPQ